MLGEIIFETKYWTVKLVQDQAYLGRCVILLNRDCGTLSGLTNDEVLDFHQNIVKKLESTFKKVFDATMFNWTCLMNNAYQKKNPKPYVHWHFRPRYDHDVKFENEVFEDREFSHHYDTARKRIITSKLLEKIANKIRANI